MATPLPVCLNTVSVQKLVTDTLPIPIPPSTIRAAGQYTCFTTVAVHLDASEWVVQNMPIHRWLLDKVFTVSDLETLGLTIAATKQLQLIPKPRPAGSPVLAANQSATATISVTSAKRGSKARQGKKIKFGLLDLLSSGLSSARTAGTAPKSFGKVVSKSASVIMPSRCTNPQIAAWFSSHLPLARLVDIKGSRVFRSNGTEIKLRALTAPADFAKQFAPRSTVAKSRLQSLTEAPVIMY